MQATRIISKVLPNGSIALPKEFLKKAGEVYEIILIPVDDAGIYAYSESIAKEKKIPRLTESELAKIIHTSRGVK
jgi:hypothetical protein